MKRKTVGNGQVQAGFSHVANEMIKKMMHNKNYRSHVPGNLELDLPMYVQCLWSVFWGRSEPMQCRSTVVLHRSAVIIFTICNLIYLRYCMIKVAQVMYRQILVVQVFHTALDKSCMLPNTQHWFERRQYMDL